MITPRIEEAIFRGKATYSRWAHAFGMFGSLKVPEGNLMIITDLTWYQFMDSFNNDLNATTRDYFRYNEYQLKIDGFKSRNFFQFRNKLIPVRSKLATASDWNGATTMSSTFITSDTYWYPGEPIKHEQLFLICQNFIKLTISRNAFIHTTPITNMGPVTSAANEPIPPNGVGGVNVLRQQDMRSKAGGITNNMFYTPPGNEAAGTTVNARNMETYNQDIDPTNSIINPSDAGMNASWVRPYQTSPLVEFGIVTINTEYWDKLANS